MKRKGFGQISEGRATTWSAVTAALASVSSRKTNDPTSRWDDFKAALNGDPLLQQAVISNTRVKWWDWLNRPWHARKVVGFQKRLAHDRDACLPAGLTQGDLRAAFTAATMIRYGVAIDHRSYRVLRGLVVDGSLSERQLKHLLSFPTVWWGTEVRTSPTDGVLLRILKQLWTMGRPPAGELKVIRFHWMTRLVLGALSVAASGSLLFVTFAAGVTWMRHGLTAEAVVYLWTAFQLALLAAGLLWLGPCADRAARVLSKSVSSMLLSGVVPSRRG